MTAYKLSLLFHELGHAYHCLSNAKIDMSVPVDAVEYPSLLLEMHALQPQNVMKMVS